MISFFLGIDAGRGVRVLELLLSWQGNGIGWSTRLSNGSYGFDATQ